jgi:hypothetical protein
MILTLQKNTFTFVADLMGVPVSGDLELFFRRIGGGKPLSFLRDAGVPLEAIVQIGDDKCAVLLEYYGVCLGLQGAAVNVYVELCAMVNGFKLRMIKEGQKSFTLSYFPPNETNNPMLVLDGESFTDEPFSPTMN